MRVGGSQPRFIALMNRRARAARAHGHPLRDPDRARPRRQPLERPRTSSSSRSSCAATAFFRDVTNRRRATLRSGAHPRTLANRNTVVDRWGPADGVKTGHTQQAGYVLVGSATQHGVTVVSVVLGEPSLAARDADSLALLRYGLSRYRRVARGPGRRGRWRRAPVTDGARGVAARARAHRRAGRSGAASRSARGSSASPPRAARARCPPAPASGRSSCAGAGASSPACRS